ncbi:terminal nucleotidyltransferase 4B-like [Zingiber officinale]|uniref:terminal nucleotidyltransferase 4B-like n=1 Tax=Zingiber officinale TaxID=94328 RepID=UPI001C4BD7CA|nr:terminal nucleotidyltransferase 4B-like [Zingiber officinale]
MGESGAFLYDTVCSLAYSPEVDPHPTESYSIFRNQITSSAGSFSEVAATDYLSLDPIRTFELPAPLETPPLASVPAPVGADHGRVSELACFRAGCRFKSPMLQLHKEILDFCDFISPTPEEQASRSAAAQCISDIIKNIWPHCRVEIFGSFRTGLYLPTSDIDVVVLDSEVKTPQIGLYALARALSQRSVAKKVQVIAKARIPIIKFMEKKSGVAFDISFDVDNGPKAADYMKDAVQKLPPLRPLCLVLKVFLQQRELNEVYSGGIGSYALLVMLIVYLQMHWSGLDSHSSRCHMEDNLGILLVGFFEFFGRKLNTSNVGISCNSKRVFFSKTDKGFFNSERSYLLSIEDPQAPDNDLAKNSYNYFMVRSAFAAAYSTLTDVKAIMRLGPESGILGNIIRPDPVLFDRKRAGDGQLTFNNLLSGADKSMMEAHCFENGGDVYNWQLVDDEPLPREKLNNNNDSIPSWKRFSKSKHWQDRREKPEIIDSDNKEKSSRSASASKRRKRFEKSEHFDNDHKEKSPLSASASKQRGKILGKKLYRENI